MASYKPHAVFISVPIQGHLKYLLKLAKLFHNRGSHITFVNSDYNHRRFLNSRGPNALDGLSDFNFKTIPDGLHAEHGDEASQHYAALADSMSKNNLLAPFVEIVKEVNRDENVPEVTCIVADGFMGFTVEAARQLGVPIYLFFTVAACCFWAFKQFRALRDRGIIPLKDESYLTNGYLDSIIDWVPGMKDMRLRDFPGFVQSTDPNDLMSHFVLNATEKSSEANGVILHTFDALERDVLDAISSFLPNLYTVGPLQLLLNNTKEDLSKSVGYNLWEEDDECHKWLDTKEKQSVLYVNFGSIAKMTHEQVVELAMGLANSGYPFLWIIRLDLVSGKSAVLPPEFTVATRERGMISSWCNQEEVLNHESVGGFLTHCGWGSTTESLSAGVPMLCLPFMGDQKTNCRFVCVEWGFGMEIDINVKRDEVEKRVKELFEGENGVKIREKAEEWKNLANEAASICGSSSLSFDKLVDTIF
jgi:UDP:flavonoid glycosyltransferase YjiC (YdhE family)